MDIETLNALRGERNGEGYTSSPNHHLFTIDINPSVEIGHCLSGNKRAEHYNRGQLSPIRETAD